jgi:hypothetical protein
LVTEGNQVRRNSPSPLLPATDIGGYFPSRQSASKRQAVPSL